MCCQAVVGPVMSSSMACKATSNAYCLQASDQPCQAAPALSAGGLTSMLQWSVYCCGLLLTPLVLPLFCCKTLVLVQAATLHKQPQLTLQPGLDSYGVWLASGTDTCHFNNNAMPQHQNSSRRVVDKVQLDTWAISAEGHVCAMRLLETPCRIVCCQTLGGGL
jgi:hypothetical protein